MRRLAFLLLWIGALALVLVPGARAEQPVRLVVDAYVDINGDKLMNEGEGIDNVLVTVDVDGQRQVKIMHAGTVIFSLPYVKIESIQVEIPYLAVAEQIKPKDNLAQVYFRLKAPELPVYLP